ncbi:uncharacterized protein At1g66480-like [Rhodamnia argentea]|uniref:Uncharacterized protein At1g66480-like n=1 Tax=Rhodamnia argentea TaxID=178133 RepID=A0A8B8PQ01_9MYRT|nr:uncharacterized protein At1g66480-like [Rhodamnia argentea]XP_048140477.1 uncharacterized protein At1g66480-like [Rhodamnia argentea]
MGNSLGGKRRAKVMKINGDTFKLATPVRVGDVVKDYPGHVLMDSEAVRHYGIRAKPLEPQQELKPKRVYFLVELPKFPEEEEENKFPRRVRSAAIQMSAKDRLECLMLSRRAASDLSLARPPPSRGPEGHRQPPQQGGGGGGGGPLTVKMRLTRAEMARLVEESRDETEVAERIVSLCYGDENVLRQGGSNWTHGHGGTREKSSSIKLPERRVRFNPTEGGEIRPEIQPGSS